jgi:hypothetical protein
MSGLASCLAQVIQPERCIEPPLAEGCSEASARAWVAAQISALLGQLLHVWNRGPRELAGSSPATPDAGRGGPLRHRPYARAMHGKY